MNWLPGIDRAGLMRQLREGPEFGRVERLVARGLFAWLLWDVFQSLSGKAPRLVGEPAPVGIAHFVDVTVFANERLLEGLGIVLGLGLALYVLGRGLPVVLPVIWLILLGPGTLVHSQGAILHSTQLTMLVLTGQMVWAVQHGIRRLVGVAGRDPAATEAFFRQLMWLSLQIVAAGYLVTGITKMWESEGAWVKDAQYFPLQLEKAYWAHYYNKLEDPRGDAGEGGGPIQAMSRQMEDMMRASPNASRFFLGCGLLLEFGAVLALLGRRWALGIGLGLILLHLTIAQIMSLHFGAHLALLAIYFVNAPYWVLAGAERIGWLPRC